MIEIKKKVSEQEAHVILEPLFENIWEDVQDMCEKPVKLEVKQNMESFTGFNTDGTKIFLGVEIVEMDTEIVYELILHTFGHIIDHQYPAMFIIEGERKLKIFPGKEYSKP